MELLTRADSWDYLALALAAGALWLLCGGIARLQAANPEQVDAARLRVRAWGALAAGAVYIACRLIAG